MDCGVSLCRKEVECTRDRQLRTRNYECLKEGSNRLGVIKLAMFLV